MEKTANNCRAENELNCDDVRTQAGCVVVVQSEDVLREKSSSKWSVYIVSETSEVRDASERSKSRRVKRAAASRRRNTSTDRSNTSTIVSSRSTKSARRSSSAKHWTYGVESASKQGILDR